MPVFHAPDATAGVGLVLHPGGSTGSLSTSALTRSRNALLLEKPENGQRVGCAHEDLAAGHGWRNELIARAELVAAPGGLVAVVKLLREV